jgi:hypothetical protein
VNIWENNDGKDGAHYSIIRAKNGCSTMKALREIFPDAKADEMNFVLFSTSGVHGTYQTIEEEQEASTEERCGVTFLIVHPRLVALRYGNCYPKTENDFKFLKALRQSSWEVMQNIGKSADKGSQS